MWSSGSSRIFKSSLVVLVLSVYQINCYSFEDHISGVSYIRNGDINLGGLIPLRNSNSATQSCGSLRDLGSLKRVEAMVYAIDRINADSTLLPNTNLGFEIRDTCYNTAIALAESLNFVSSPATATDKCCNGTCPEKKPVVGVVGAQRSASSKQAAILFGLYHLPQIAFLSTSEELSDNITYPNFLRVVGPDSFQVTAMIDIIIRYNWKYVSFINSDDTYGKSAQEQFNKLAKEHGICIGITRTISLADYDDDVKDVVKELLALQDGNSAGTVVILFTLRDMAQSIFSAASEMNATRKFIWMGSDGWGNYGEKVTQGNEEVTLGR